MCIARSQCPLRVFGAPAPSQGWDQIQGVLSPLCLCLSAQPTPSRVTGTSNAMQPCSGDAQSSKDTSLVSLLLKGRGCSGPQVQGWRHCAKKGIKVLQTLNPCKGSHLDHVLRAWLGLTLSITASGTACTVPNPTTPSNLTVLPRP